MGCFYWLINLCQNELRLTIQIRINCKQQVLRLYKQLLWTAKSYPNKPYSEIRQKIKNAFLKNANITDKTELQNAIDKGCMHYQTSSNVIRKIYYQRDGKSNLFSQIQV